MNNIDKQILEQDKIREKYFHDLIIKSDNIKSDFLSILGLPDNLSGLNLIHEDKYINGITADFTLVYNNQTRAILECKAGDIGVTDYVRGIGQIMQYEHFNEKNISSKGLQYSNAFNSLLVLPSSVLINKNFNIGKFKYPKSTMLIEINEISNIARRVSEKELLNLGSIEDEKLTSISQYYIRDNRLFELYMLLRYACVLKLRNAKRIDRKKVEDELKKTNTINNGNWRNAWIGLSSLGLIDSNNLPTKSGVNLGNLEFEDFLVIIFDSYIKPYIEVLMEYFKNGIANSSKSLKEIKNDIVDKFEGKEVLFLTQSETRYLSSWINILRDDFGCLSFDTRNNNRTIIYNPLELNEMALKSNIKKHSISKKYIEKLNELL